MTYESLGLRCNPFVADPEPGVAPPLYIEREVDPPIPDAHRLIQVIGPRGSGKTTLLLHWQRTVGGRYLHVEQGRARWRPVPIASLAYWDEADRIPRMILRRSLGAAAQIGATVVLGVHRDLRRAARMPGATIRRVRLPAPTPATVQVWAARRLAAASVLGRRPAVHVDAELAERVAADCDGSWRVVGDRLHSWVAQAARQSSISPPS